MPDVRGKDVRTVILEVVKKNDPSLDRQTVLADSEILGKAASEIGISGDDEEQVLLEEFYDLFKIGVLCWGKNLANPKSPHFHISRRGKQVLETLNRDPSNPSAYQSHLQNQGTLNKICESYIREALISYNANAFKSAAVMIGCASESTILELRDSCEKRIIRKGSSVPKNMQDWRVKQTIAAVRQYLDAEKANFDLDLREEFEAYWTAFTQQIRSARNDAGHPASIDPITPDTVRSSFLIFPELVKLSTKLITWVNNN